MQVNGYGELEQVYILATAQELLDIYEDNTEDGVTTEGGLIDMQAVMDDVPDNLRGGVFGTLLYLLRDADIDYDVDAFQKRYTN